jgi:two-component system nitrate/nitrite response regulator NarL
LEEAAALAASAQRPNVPRVSTILAAAGDLFQERLCRRLLDAGYEAPTEIASPAALGEFLRECEEDTLVLTGGDWPAPRPFLRVAVRAAAPTIVLLNAATRRVEQMALAEGAHAALDADVPPNSLAVALAAVQAGLIVLDQPLRAISRALDPDFLDADAEPFGTARRSARPLTAREREILSLVAGGTSNKGVARVLAVSTNTVKFHLAAVFEKLAVTTRAEAVAEAIRRGDLSL